MVRRGGHQHGDYLVDALSWYATRELIGRFGLLLLASVLHDGPDTVVVTLASPAD